MRERNMCKYKKNCKNKKLYDLSFGYYHKHGNCVIYLFMNFYEIIASSNKQWKEKDISVILLVLKYSN